ncbi:Lysophospholipid acyltransferase LPEAT2 [Senna tora]|uniref:Lysophospholipid acyltransferase LPEAT2 n=1 Tax=Senna tora TaxID=362788 RepID=A0A834TTB7_9FABA|nr:Lysophospholipid acyltransferase LPEAT2 [Senna tora]
MASSLLSSLPNHQIRSFSRSATTISTVHPPNPALETTIPNFPILIDRTTAKLQWILTIHFDSVDIVVCLSIALVCLLSLGSIWLSDMSPRNWLLKDGRIRRTRCREDDDGGGGGGRWRR